MKKYILIIFCLVSIRTNAQWKKSFDNEVNLSCTTVKDQARSSVCWSFASLSFLESELIRQGKKTYDLSEMFITWHAYYLKVIEHLNQKGQNTFTPGGQAHDVMQVIKKYGIVPESVYTGRHAWENQHNHAQLDTAMKKFVSKLIDKKEYQLSKKREKQLKKILNKYLGEPPTWFFDKDTQRQLSPKEYAEKVIGIDPNDYVEITSYTHEPFFQTFVFPSMFNWNNALYHNVPLDDFMEIVVHALQNEFTLVWDGDVSEKTFKFKDGVAFLIRSQENINAELRQKAFEDQSTKIDHLMHIVGKAKDDEGVTHYIMKNSWGTNNLYKGFMYMSAPYFKLKTVAIMLHKDGIPPAIRSKMGL